MSTHVLRLTLMVLFLLHSRMSQITAYSNQLKILHELDFEVYAFSGIISLKLLPELTQYACRHVSPLKTVDGFRRNVVSECTNTQVIQRSWLVSSAHTVHESRIEFHIYFGQNCLFIQFKIFIQVFRCGEYSMAVFLKPWSADHKWSSGSALVVLLDWTLVQKRQKNINIKLRES
jgi:hypothetical protein